MEISSVSTFPLGSEFSLRRLHPANVQNKREPRPPCPALRPDSRIHQDRQARLVGARALQHYAGCIDVISLDRAMTAKCGRPGMVLRRPLAPPSPTGRPHVPRQCDFLSNPWGFKGLETSANTARQDRSALLSTLSGETLKSTANALINHMIWI